MKNVVIPVDIDTEAGLSAFLQAISKPENLDQIDANKLPKDAKALVELIKDRPLMDKFKGLGQQIVSRQNEAVSGIRPLSSETISPLKLQADELKKEIYDKHGDAVELLKKFTEYQEAKEILRVRGIAAGIPVAVTDVVAIAEVYANVAVATNFAVAAAVLVVIGAVVV